MTSTLRVTTAAPLLTLAALVAAAAAPPRDAEPPGTLLPTGAAAPPLVTLAGAFGVVAGADPAAPATAYPGVALDTFVRAAPLRLHVDIAAEDLVEITVTSHPSGGRQASPLAQRDGLLSGPDSPGSSVIVARVVTRDHGTTEHAWLVDVPDRVGGWETLLQLVPPSVLLASGRGELVGVAGNGCYAYLCSDVGGLGSPETVPALAAGTGETLAVRTADGSGLSGWSGRLHPLGRNAEGQPLSAHGAAAPPRSEIELHGLEPGGAGEWLLELRVDLDRERGYLWQAFRLVVE